MTLEEKLDQLLAQGKFFELEELFLSLIHIFCIRNREELAEALEKLDFPVVIKAVDLMGSRGIFRCDTSEQAFSFYEKTMEATGKDYCLVEEFIEGEPFGCEAMMSEGRLLDVYKRQECIC